MVTAVGLPLTGLALDPSDPLAPGRLIGYASAVIALAVGGYTLSFTIQFEARSPAEQEDDPRAERPTGLPTAS